MIKIPLPPAGGKLCEAFLTRSGTAKFAVPVPFRPITGHSEESDCRGTEGNASGRIPRLNGTAERRTLPRNVPLPRFSFPFSFLAKLFPGIHIFFTVLPVYNPFLLLYNVKVRVYEDSVPD